MCRYRIEREREINVKCCRNIDLRKASNPIFSKKYFSQDLYAYLKKKVYSPLNYCTIVQLRQLFFIKRGLFHLIRLKIRWLMHFIAINSNTYNKIFIETGLDCLVEAVRNTTETRWNVTLSTKTEWLHSIFQESLINIRVAYYRYKHTRWITSSKQQALINFFPKYSHLLLTLIVLNGLTSLYLRSLSTTRHFPP